MKIIFILMQIKSFSQERFCTLFRFDVDEFWNSEMAYCNFVSFTHLLGLNTSTALAWITSGKWHAPYLLAENPGGGGTPGKSGSLGGDVPPGSPNSDSISDQRMSFFAPILRPGL